jgi:hypothetical protein
MNWSKMDANYDLHPQVIDAGWHGAQLFLFLIRLNRRHDLHGFIPEKYLAVTFLVRVWGCPQDFPFHETVETMKRCGLVVARDGGLEIDGWRRWDPPKDLSTERVRRFRRNETQRNGGNEGTDRIEENRIEEKEDIVPQEPSQLQFAPEDLIGEVRKWDASQDPLVGLWNELMGEANRGLPEAHQIPLVREIGEERKAKIKSRLKEHSLDEWRTCINRIRYSPFLIGDNSKGWKANFDFLLRPGTYAKVIEGNYDRALVKPRSMSQGMTRG